MYYISFFIFKSSNWKFVHFAWNNNLFEYFRISTRMPNQHRCILKSRTKVFYHSSNLNIPCCKLGNTCPNFVRFKIQNWNSNRMQNINLLAWLTRTAWLPIRHLTLLIALTVYNVSVCGIFWIKAVPFMLSISLHVGHWSRDNYGLHRPFFTHVRRFHIICLAQNSISKYFILLSRPIEIRSFWFAFRKCFTLNHTERFTVNQNNYPSEQSKQFECKETHTIAICKKRHKRIQWDF